MFKNVKELASDRPLLTVKPDNTVLDACKKMTDHDERAILILDDSALVGILSERDIVQKCIAKDLGLETPVSTVMTREIKSIQADDTIAKALEIMVEGGFHHIPVMEDGIPIALLSSDDIPEEYRMLLERYRELKGRT